MEAVGREAPLFSQAAAWPTSSGLGRDPTDGDQGGKDHVPSKGPSNAYAQAVPVNC